MEETSGVTVLAQRLAKALRAVPKPESRRFVWLVGEYLRHEGRTLAWPDVVRRQMRHLRALWPLRMGELTPRRVQAHLTSLHKRNGGTLTGSTINKLRAAGGRVIRSAQLSGEWDGLNPFDVVKREKETRRAQYVPTAEELRRVLPHLRPDRRREAVFNVILGPRPGEMKALQRVDVDAHARTITFRRSNARDETKTGVERVVPVPDWLWPELEAALKASRSAKLVFPKADGGRQRADTKLTATLRTAYRKAGIVSAYRYICRRRACGYRDLLQEKKARRCPKCAFKLWRWEETPPVTWYALRHASATLHRLAGCDELVIQRCLGHSENMTGKWYTRHLPIEYMRAELSKLRL